MFAGSITDQFFGQSLNWTITRNHSAVNQYRLDWELLQVMCRLGNRVWAASQSVL